MAKLKVIKHVKKSCTGCPYFREEKGMKFCDSTVCLRGFW